MNSNCNVIRDLLPLYADGICSEESRELIEEHIKNCPECNEELQKAKSCPEFKQADENADIAKKAGKRVKSIKKRVVIKCIAASLAVFIVLAAVVSFEVLIASSRTEARLRSQQNIVRLDVARGTGGIQVFGFTVSAPDGYTHEEISVQQAGRIVHRFVTADGRQISISIVDYAHFETFELSERFLKWGMQLAGEYTDILPGENAAFVTELLLNPLPEYSFLSSPVTKLKDFAYYEGWCRTIPVKQTIYCFSNDNFSGYGYPVTFEDEGGGVSSFSSSFTSGNDIEQAEPNGAVFKLYHDKIGTAYNLVFNGEFTQAELTEFLSSVSFG